MSPPQPTALPTICVPEFRRQIVQTAECHVGSQARPRFVEIPEPVPACRIGNAGLGAASTKMKGLRPLSPEEKKETQDAE